MYPYFSWKRLIFKCLGIPQSMCSSSLLSEPNESSVLEFLGVYLRRIPVQSVVWHIHLNPTLLVQFSGRKCGQFLVSEGLFERKLVVHSVMSHYSKKRFFGKGFDPEIFHTECCLFARMQ